MINEEHGDPYMMLRITMNLSLIDLFVLRVSNPIYEFDKALVSIHTTYKSNKLYIDIFLVFWLVNNEKQIMM